jgi:hypothetical protein
MLSAYGYWPLPSFSASVLLCFCASVAIAPIVFTLWWMIYWLLAIGYWLMDTYVPIDLLSYTDEAGLM